MWDRRMADKAGFDKGSQARRGDVTCRRQDLLASSSETSWVTFMSTGFEVALKSDIMHQYRSISSIEFPPVRSVLPSIVLTGCSSFLTLMALASQAASTACMERPLVSVIVTKDRATPKTDVSASHRMMTYSTKRQRTCSSPPRSFQGRTV